jgi:hypothetical protein
MKPPFREDLSPEAEKWPLLGAVIRQLLVKTLPAGKYLACALVNCKVWKLAMALKLSVITSCVLKWSINPISNRDRFFSFSDSQFDDHILF